MRARPFAICALWFLATACSGTSSSISVTSPTAAKCEVAVENAARDAAPADGIASSLSISTNRDCTWTASPTAAWLAITSATTGQGSDTLSYRVSANAEPVQRRGVLEVNNTQVTVLQDAAPCRYNVTPANTAVSANGGEVRVAIETLTGCAWTITSAVSWIAPPASPNGDRSATVTLTVARNTSPVERTGTVTIGPQTITIQQAAAPADGGTTPTPSPTPSPAPARRPIRRGAAVTHTAFSGSRPLRLQHLADQQQRRLRRNDWNDSGGDHVRLHVAGNRERDLADDHVRIIRQRQRQRRLSRRGEHWRRQERDHHAAGKTFTFAGRRAAACVLLLDLADVTELRRGGRTGNDRHQRVGKQLLMDGNDDRAMDSLSGRTRATAMGTSGSTWPRTPPPPHAAPRSRPPEKTFTVTQAAATPPPAPCTFSISPTTQERRRRPGGIGSADVGGIRRHVLGADSDVERNVADADERRDRHRQRRRPATRFQNPAAGAQAPSRLPARR